MKVIKRGMVDDYNFPQDYNVPVDNNVPEDYNVPDGYEVLYDSVIPEDQGVPEEVSKRGTVLENIQPHLGAIILQTEHSNRREHTEEFTNVHNNEET